MNNRYTIGLDYGTNSVRALVVDITNGRELGTAVWNYKHGNEGVILSRDPTLPASILLITYRERHSASARRWQLQNNA